MPHRRYLVPVVVVVVLLSVIWVAPRLGRSVSDSFNRVSGREDLAVLEREPILAFRMPGATLFHTTAQPASSGPLGQSPVETMVEQRFTVEGDGPDALAGYEEAVQGQGWQLVGRWCSRYQRQAAVLFTKSTVIPSSLTVRVILPGGPSPTVPLPGTAPMLMLTITTGTDDEPFYNGLLLPARDIDCLRAIDPNDPAFQAHPELRRTSEQLCALLTVSVVRDVVPEVTAAVPHEPEADGASACTYEQRPYRATSTVLPIQGRMDSRPWFSVLDAAGNPKVKYEDRLYPAPGTEEGTMLLAFDERQQPPPFGVWVDAPTGPVEVHTTAEGLSQGQLLAVARLLRG
jgi:hypothetical protein